MARPARGDLVHFPCFAMPQDLLALPDYEPPMGDLFTNRRLDAGRSVWTRPLLGERDMPKKRIIHQRVVRLHGPARLLRLGVRRGPGYHKCGSRQDLDWVTGLRVLARHGGRWRVLLLRSSGAGRARRGALAQAATRS